MSLIGLSELNRSIKSGYDNNKTIDILHSDTITKYICYAFLKGCYFRVAKLLDLAHKLSKYTNANIQSVYRAFDYAI